MAKKMTESAANAMLNGGELQLKANEQDQTQTQAEQAGLTFFVADCGKARNRSAILRALAKAVDYPVFFGSDMDALLDCLSETVDEQKKGAVLWIQELHSGDPSLTDDVAELQRVLEETLAYAQEKKKIFAYYIEHVGKHSDPEPGVAPQPYAEG